MASIMQWNGLGKLCIFS